MTYACAKFKVATSKGSGDVLFLEILPCYSVIYTITGFVQTSVSKIQGLPKASLTVFKDLKLMKNTSLSVKIMLQKC